MRILAGLSFLALVACSSVSEPNEWRRVIGVLNPSLSSIQAVHAPAEVTVNEPFTVTITTVGSSSCTRADGATSKVSGNTAEVTPYDRIAPRDRACTDDLHAFPRPVTLLFTSVGEGRILVVTRTFDDVLRTVELTIQVRAR